MSTACGRGLPRNEFAALDIVDVVGWIQRIECPVIRIRMLEHIERFASVTRIQAPRTIVIDDLDDVTIVLGVESPLDQCAVRHTRIDFHEHYSHPLSVY